MDSCSTRQRILIALASWPGETPPTLRELACDVGIPHNTLKEYFSPRPVDKWAGAFRNGELVTWQPGKDRTRRLDPQAAVLRDSDGRAKAVYQIVPPCEFEARLRKLDDGLSDQKKSHN